MAETTAPPALTFDGPDDARFTVALAHGAGAPMDSPFMQAFAEGLAGRGHRVARFEFPYMAKRREDGRKRPPDGQAALLAAWRAVIAALGSPQRLVIGGKSLGGRIASLVADEANVAGLVCLGFPFHAPGKPAAARAAHLADLRTPTLIVQGTRDPMGSAEEVAGYDLSPTVRLHWAEDGDHSLAPRKSSGRTAEDNRAAAIDAVDAFLAALNGRA